VLHRVYRAVAWQRVGQISYNLLHSAKVGMNLLLKEEGQGILANVFCSYLRSVLSEANKGFSLTRS
jgi:hypothetical protein